MKVIMSPLICACVLLSGANTCNPPKHDVVARLSGAVLLVGYGSMEPITVSFEHAEQDKILNPEYRGPRLYPNIYPNITRDGTIMASARLQFRPQPHYEVAIYDIVSNRWHEFGYEVSSGSVAISPDASKLAFVATPPNSMATIKILNLATGQLYSGPEADNESMISWAPDSTRFAYVSDIPIRSKHKYLHLVRPVISVFDTITAKPGYVIYGSFPAWSPNGEWIAFLDDGGRLAVTHLDGSQAHLLAKRGGTPVWSPDSKFLLLNSSFDEDGAVDIRIIEFATGKLVRQFRRMLPVQAWAEWNPQSHD